MTPIVWERIGGWKNLRQTFDHISILWCGNDGHKIRSKHAKKICWFLKKGVSQINLYLSVITKQWKLVMKKEIFGALHN